MKSINIIGITIGIIMMFLGAILIDFGILIAFAIMLISVGLFTSAGFLIGGLFNE